MKRQDLLAAWRQEEQKPFAGWDFSHLVGRMIEEQPPWSYAVPVLGLREDRPPLLSSSRRASAEPETNQNPCQALPTSPDV